MFVVVLLGITVLCVVINVLIGHGERAWKAEKERARNR